ncbi:MAG: hypothetical protein ACOCUI_02320 [bacterium]
MKEIINIEKTYIIIYNYFVNIFLNKLYEQKENYPAFIIGNGINRYANNEASKEDSDLISWEEILKKIHTEYFDNNTNELDSTFFSNISLPEFSDILDIEISEKGKKNYFIKQAFINEVDKLISTEKHQKINHFCRTNNIPIITTNFDEALINNELDNYIKLKHHKKFSDFYPWYSFYGPNNLKKEQTNNFDNTKEYGIWHCHGLIKYKRSIRLSLSDYVGAIEKARKLIHSNEQSLFHGKDRYNWKGKNSWLNIIFNNNLFILGLSLEKDETFLRWLLIERKKYFIKFPERKKDAFYITKKGETHLSKKYFLSSLGIETIEVDNYSDIYEIFNF